MLLLIFIIAIVLVFASTLRKAKALHNASSRPIYYSAYAFIVFVLPISLVSTLWLVSEPLYIQPIVLSQVQSDYHVDGDEAKFIFNEIKQGIYNKSAPQKGTELYFKETKNVDLVIYFLMLLSATLSLKSIVTNLNPHFKAREKVECYVRWFLAFSSLIAVLITAGIVFSLLFETIKFFQKIPFFDFIVGTKWSPQMALRADQVGSSGAFGFIPLLTGTLLISLIAMMIAVPIGLFSAIYLAEYAHPKVRLVLKPALEILAGIPTVVYGFIAALTVAPSIVKAAEYFNLSASSESALAAGLVMGVMIIPFISSLSEDVISSVPNYLREGALALGATPAETITQVVLPAALPGIVSAVILGFSRAVGETMIVVMAAGLAANVTANPLESVTTITAQIVTILVGDQAFDSPKTMAAFALGLSLFCITLLLNMVALKVVRQYREQYD